MNRYSVKPGLGNCHLAVMLQGYKNVNPNGEEGVWLRINQKTLHLY
jgi:hypothetical protein